jgi:hypothetical protein
MLEALPKAAFSALASSQFLKRVASRYGMRRPGSFARRFIAGETVAEAIDAARVCVCRACRDAHVYSTSPRQAIRPPAPTSSDRRDRARRIGRLARWLATPASMSIARPASTTCGASSMRRPARFFVRMTGLALPTRRSARSIWNIGCRVGFVIIICRSAKDIDIDAQRARAAGEGCARGGRCLSAKAEVDAVRRADARELLRRIRHRHTIGDDRRHDVRDTHRVSQMAANLDALWHLALQTKLSADLAQISSACRSAEWFPSSLRQLGKGPPAVVRFTQLFRRKAVPG